MSMLHRQLMGKGCLEGLNLEAASLTNGLYTLRSNRFLFFHSLLSRRPSLNLQLSEKEKIYRILQFYLTTIICI